MATRYSKQVKELLAQLPGWSVDTTRGHLKLTHDASASVVFTSKTPSCSRAYKNALAKCRRVEKENEDNG